MSPDRNAQPIIIHKNRKRACWALGIILLMVPISGWLVFLGLRSGRQEVGWSLVIMGALGLVAFVGSAVLIVTTMRAPWHVELSPAHLGLYTPLYDLRVPWDGIASIGLLEANRRPGCALVFEDATQVVQSTTFHAGPRRADAVTNKATMLARMEENLVHWGYHLAIPGHILEMGAEELAELLTRARTGMLWQRESLCGAPAIASAHASSTAETSAREREGAHRPKERG